MREYFRENGHEVNIIDQLEIDQVDIAIFVGLRSGTEYYRQLRKRAPAATLVNIARELPVYSPQHSESKLIRLANFFDCIFTWNDSLVSVDGFRKYHWPIAPEQFNTDNPEIPPSDRRLLANVSSMTSSPHPDELYSERERIVQFYERNHPEKFDLYGQNWGRDTHAVDISEDRWYPPEYDTYRGESESKAQTFAGHKFALVFENQTGLEGWVSEKIFDAFAGGAVPIYWGANNICQYLPEETFMDYRRFGSPQALHSYIDSMTDREYDSYLSAINQYINTGLGQFDIRRVTEAFCENVIDVDRSIPRDGSRLSKEFEFIDELKRSYDRNVRMSIVAGKLTESFLHPPPELSRLEVVCRAVQMLMNEKIRAK